MFPLPFSKVGCAPSMKFSLPGYQCPVRLCRQRPTTLQSLARHVNAVHPEFLWDYDALSKYGFAQCVLCHATVAPSGGINTIAHVCDCSAQHTPFFPVATSQQTSPANSGAHLRWLQPTTTPPTYPRQHPPPTVIATPVNPKRVPLKRRSRSQSEEHRPTKRSEITVSTTLSTCLSRPHSRRSTSPLARPQSNPLEPPRPYPPSTPTAPLIPQTPPPPQSSSLELSQQPPLADNIAPALTAQHTSTPPTSPSQQTPTAVNATPANPMQLSLKRRSRSHSEEHRPSKRSDITISTTPSTWLSRPHSRRSASPCARPQSNPYEPSRPYPPSTPTAPLISQTPPPPHSSSLELSQQPPLADNIAPALMAQHTSTPPTSPRQQTPTAVNATPANPMQLSLKRRSRSHSEENRPAKRNDITISTTLSTRMSRPHPRPPPSALPAPTPLPSPVPTTSTSTDANHSYPPPPRHTSPPQHMPATPQLIPTRQVSSQAVPRSPPLTLAPPHVPSPSHSYLFEPPVSAPTLPPLAPPPPHLPLAPQHTLPETHHNQPSPSPTNKASPQIPAKHAFQTF